MNSMAFKWFHMVFKGFYIDLGAFYSNLLPLKGRPFENMLCGGLYGVSKALFDNIVRF